MLHLLRGARRHLFHSRPDIRFCSVHSKLNSSITAVTKNNENYLSWIHPDNKQDVIRIMEITEVAARRWEIGYTDFIDQSLLADAMSAISQRDDVTAVAWGGFSQAERCRLIIGNSDILGELMDNPGTSNCVAALQVKGNFMFDPAKHPDFLGAILGTGIVREKVGDILVQGESGAQILVHPDLVDHFELELKKVRTVPVEVTRIPISDLRVQPARTEEFTSIETSMRLDAIASAGFRMSRTKMSEMIKNGDVRVNWRSVTKPGSEVPLGGVVSVAGKGRLKVKSVEETKKEKLVVTLVRYT